MAATSLSIGLVFFAGSLTVFSPCVLPILPILLGRSLTTHRLGPLCLISGLVLSFAITGSLLGVSTQWFAGFMSLLRELSIVLLLVLGILTGFPDRSYQLFSRLPISRWVKEPTQGGLGGEFLIGTQLGLLWTPCAGPVLSSILLVSINQKFTQALLLLLIFGLGAAIPMGLIAYGSQRLVQRLLTLRTLNIRWHKLSSGLIIRVVGK
ncbi:cytochrome c biogenesis CcdA family protein [Alkalinema pantanalense CENA528]|uniref:cytochrome c biogenesis CcdA family protein n=1 Tax=Alkalinema pantanalense TaxID=1620705 RepID=UPI003D6EDB84